MLLAVAIAPASSAQVVGAPTPIPVPPIPRAAAIGRPSRKSTLPVIAPPPSHPVIDLPEAPEISRVAIPPEAAITLADKTDPVPPPPSGTLTAAPPMASPGADLSNIEEVFFIVDPGSSQFSASAEGKLRDVAKDIGPAPRIPVGGPYLLAQQGAQRRHGETACRWPDSSQSGSF